MSKIQAKPDVTQAKETQMCYCNIFSFTISQIILVSVYYNSEFLYIILYAILHILYSIDIIVAIKIGIMLVIPNLHVSLEAVEWRLV